MDNNAINPTSTAPQPPRSHRFGGLGQRAILTLTAIGLLTGGVAGGYVVSHAATATSTSATTLAAATTTPTAGSGTEKFVPNENATHEAGESAAREAQENAGQVPTVP
jgi:hypothetical protein